MGLSEGYNYIATKDVDFDNTIDYDNGVKIPYGLEKFRIAESGSVLLCIEGGSAGRKIALTNEDVCFGNKLCCFTSYGLNIEFLYYYLQSPIFKEIFKSEKTGIIGGVSIGKIRNFFIPIPPLNEQKRIVNKIKEFIPLIKHYDSYEKRLDKLNKEFPNKIKSSILQEAIQGKLVPQDPNDEPASVLLERIKKEKEQLIKEKKIKRNKNESFIFKENNHFYEKIGNKEPICIDDEIPFEIPENWIWTRIKNIVTKLTDGAHKTPKYIEKGIPFLSVKDISSGYLDFSNTKFISEKDFKSLYQRCNYQNGDILLTKVGTTGIPVIINTDKDFSFFVSVALLKFNHELIYNKFLIYLINSPLVQIQCMENTKGVGNKNWVLRDIGETLITLPPLNEQKRIVKKIDILLNH